MSIVSGFHDEMCDCRTPLFFICHSLLSLKQMKQFFLEGKILTLNPPGFRPTQIYTHLKRHFFGYKPWAYIQDFTVTSKKHWHQVPPSFWSHFKAYFYVFDAFYTSCLSAFKSCPKGFLISFSKCSHHSPLKSVIF